MNHRHLYSIDLECMSVECFKNRFMTQKAMVVGINGPSGCGKSTLAQSLVDRLKSTFTSIDANIQVYPFPEDTKYFLAPKAASCRDQNPDSETPDFVNWEVYVDDLQNCLARDQPKMMESGSDHAIVWIIDHFLLLHDQRVVNCLDLLIFLDPLCNNHETVLRNQSHHSTPLTPTKPTAFTTSNTLFSTLASRDTCRERRVQRDPHRLPSERDFLRHYYNHAVWPANLRYTHHS